MRFSFTDEQEQIRDVVRRFLAEQSPTGEIRRLMATDEGWDRAVWQRLSGELGLAGVHIPEVYGGQGLGFVELCVVLEEMGRALLCAPYFASVVLAANAILNGASEDQRRELLPGIAAGATVATLAFAEDDGRWDGTSTALTATRIGSGYRLSGIKSFVLDGHTADLILVLARAPGSGGSAGLSLFAVPGDAPGLERRLLKSVDGTRKLARLTFDQVPAQLLGEEGAAAAPLSRTLDQAAICLANEMVGGAEHLRQSALDYVMLRMQFGRPIASFQAIKHKCADMLVDVELAKSAAYYAAEAAAEEDPDLPALASLAKACAADAFMQTARETIQLHGGIGFTWDNDTHLWFKRAKSSEVFLGSPSHHRELLMQRWNV